MTLYCESSALLSVYLKEATRHAIVQGELEQELAVCSDLNFIEVQSALARARFKDNPPRLTKVGFERAVRVFESDWANYIRVPVSNGLLEDAAHLARSYLLRAYDAVHLATALSIRERVPDQLLVSTWDEELASAATAEGLSLAHEVNS